MGRYFVPFNQYSINKHIFTHIEWRMTLRSVEAETDALPSGWVWSDQAGLAHKYAVPNAFERALGLAAERLGTGAEAV